MTLDEERERIEKAPEVSGKMDKFGGSAWVSYPRRSRMDTHRGRLVCIEEIK